MNSLFFALDTKDAEWYYHTYLINWTETHFRSITLESGGFYSDDEGVYPTETVKLELENIEPYSYKNVDRIDYMELELNVWYQLECIDNKGEVSHYDINIPKWLPEDEAEEIPYLQKMGWVLQLTPTSAE